MKFSLTDYSSPLTVGQYHIDVVKGVRTEKFRGLVHLSDLKANLAAMVSDSCWSSGHHSLIDFTEATLEIESNEVLRFALALRNQLHPSNGWLVFVAPDPTSFAFVRMLGYWSRTTERTRIFGKLGDAESWLAKNQLTQPPKVAERASISVVPKLLEAI